MESLDLFSHPQAPQIPCADSGSAEPVQVPVFSDQPGRKTRSDSRLS